MIGILTKNIPSMPSVNPKLQELCGIIFAFLESGQFLELNSNLDECTALYLRKYCISSIMGEMYTSFQKTLHKIVMNVQMYSCVFERALYTFYESTDLHFRKPALLMNIQM